MLLVTVALLALGRIADTELVSTGTGSWGAMLGGALRIDSGVVAYRDDRQPATGQPVNEPGPVSRCGNATSSRADGGRGARVRAGRPVRS